MSSSLVQVASSSSKIRSKKVDVEALSTKVIDSVDQTTFRSLVYQIAVLAESTEKVSYRELAVIREDTSDLKETVSNKFGSPINVAVNTTVLGGFVRIEITNNENYPLKVGFSKTKII